MSKKLIVIEGLDGSGKATQTDLLCEDLNKLGEKVKHITFPDYDKPSSILAKMLLNGELGSKPEDINSYASGVFFSVDRIASYFKYWKNNYDNEEIIVADRYTTSNEVYQTVNISADERDEFLGWFEDFEYNKLGLPRPNIVIYLDMPIEVSQKLMSKRYDWKEEKKDIYEKNVEFLYKCRKSALYCVDKFGWIRIECSKNGEPRSLEDIHKDIMNAVRKELL